MSPKNCCHPLIHMSTQPVHAHVAWHHARHGITRLRGSRSRTPSFSASSRPCGVSQKANKVRAPKYLATSADCRQVLKRYWQTRQSQPSDEHELMYHLGSGPLGRHSRCSNSFPGASRWRGRLSMRNQGSGRSAELRWGGWLVEITLASRRRVTQLTPSSRAIQSSLRRVLCAFRSFNAPRARINIHQTRVNPWAYHEKSVNKQGKHGLHVIFLY